MDDITKYIIARWAYSIGQPIMSDPEYTILDRAVKAQYPDNPYCNRSWSSDPCPVELLKEHGYADMIQAVVLTDKTESIPSLASPFEVRQEYGMMSSPHSVSYKIDGWNIQATYYNGSLVHVQTRGRSHDALNANVLAERIPATIPVGGRVLVTLECSIPDKDFLWFKDYFGSTSQRGAVSTALANPVTCMPHIALHAHGIRCEEKVTDKFKLLESCGFQTPMHAWVHSYDELMKQVEAFSLYKKEYGIPTDGLVVEGESTRALRIAAWEEPIYRTFITGYTESYGPHSIAIQVTVYPIALPNSVQRQLPATNLKRIIDLNLRIGNPVAFRIASSAIADIDEWSTVLLQKEWKGRESDYRMQVQLNEAMKLN